LKIVSEKYLQKNIKSKPHLQVIEKTEKVKNHLETKLRICNELMEPKDVEIKTLKTSLHEASNEFIDNLKLKQRQGASIESLQLKNHQLALEIKKEAVAKQEFEKQIAAFKLDLHNLIHNWSDPKVLQGEVRQLFRDHCGEDIPKDILSRGGGGRGMIFGDTSVLARMATAGLGTPGGNSNAGTPSAGGNGTGDAVVSTASGGGTTAGKTPGTAAGKDGKAGFFGGGKER
jgi:hypothetical protein